MLVDLYHISYTLNISGIPMHIQTHRHNWESLGEPLISDFRILYKVRKYGSCSQKRKEKKKQLCQDELVQRLVFLFFRIQYWSVYQCLNVLVTHQITFYIFSVTPLCIIRLRPNDQPSPYWIFCIFITFHSPSPFPQLYKCVSVEVVLYATEKVN